MLAALIPLVPGFNNVGQSGEIVAVQAANSNEAATVSIKAVDSLTIFTNATAQVVTYEPAWRVTVTNRNAYTGYRLPESAFPIVYQESGVTKQIKGNDELPTAEVELSAIVYYISDGTEVGFGIESPWPFLYSYPDGMTFAGAAGIANTSPCLEYVEEPASFSTNVVGYLDYSVFVDTNGVSTIIGEPVRFDMAITNTVITARVAAETYTATNELATVTTSDHFGSTVTNAFIFGGGIVVEGAQDGDKIYLLTK